MTVISDVTDSEERDARDVPTLNELQALTPPKSDAVATDKHKHIL